MNITGKLEILNKNSGSYWSKRILAQLEYAARLSESRMNKYDDLLDQAAGFLYGDFCENGRIGDKVARQAEEMIAGLSEEAKSLKILCVAHAHIDMNWMWSFAETVAVTLDTFRTMLNLMKEYPAFRFSQSQASVYKIVEEYDPAMLEEIKAMVREGRWEVTASTWVEADKNMPSAESLSRHILYTKQYLSGLLDITPESLELDFEPDTFGHSLNIPEILANGGVKYYYHCRGYDHHHIYNWRAPSGSTLLVFRDPDWYLGPISPKIAMIAPAFCGMYGIDTCLHVYGVGDHGGGPTRRDIETIVDMGSWPVFPAVRCGTMIEYFKIIEKNRAGFPVVDHELNPIFTGCYTSQSRIKMANRIGEARLFEAEAFSAAAALFAGGSYRTRAFAQAWQKILFNQFHDILPGSGVIDTREYALGEFQKVLALANTEESSAMRRIAAKMKTDGLAAIPAGTGQSTSEGAGVGFAIQDFCLPQTERGSGQRRIMHVFNPSARDRRENAEMTIWDWDVDPDRIEVRDSAGQPVRHQVLAGGSRETGQSDYWGHTYIKLLAEAAVPAFGCATYVLSEKDSHMKSAIPNTGPRVDRPDRTILENEKVRITFDSINASITSFMDKETGREMIEPRRPAGIFRLSDEDDAKGMTAWIVGRLMNARDVVENVIITSYQAEPGARRQQLHFKASFSASSLDVTVSLDSGSTFLQYDAECDWRENAVPGKRVPQLSFRFPFGAPCDEYLYDIPAGTITRAGTDMDLPANSWVAGVPKTGGEKAAMIVTGTKYGFRCVDRSLSVTLIRSSYDPDPAPEIGIHRIRFAAGFTGLNSKAALIGLAYDDCHPLRVMSGTVHGGVLPPTMGFLSVESGNAALSGIKMAESGCESRSLVFRIYETEGHEGEVVIRLAGPVCRAFFADATEQPLAGGGPVKIDGCSIRFAIGPNKLVNVFAVLE